MQVLSIRHDFVWIYDLHVHFIDGSCYNVDLHKIRVHTFKGHVNVRHDMWSSLYYFDRADGLLKISNFTIKCWGTLSTSEDCAIHLISSSRPPESGFAGFGLSISSTVTYCSPWSSIVVHIMWFIHAVWPACIIQTSRLSSTENRIEFDRPGGRDRNNKTSRQIECLPCRSAGNVSPGARKCSCIRRLGSS